MKAFALPSATEPATVVELPDPDPPEGGVRVRIPAASVNGFDAFQATGGLVAMMPHEFPTVIGRDFSGVVDAVGAGRTDVVAGDEVIGFVPSMPPLHEGTFATLLARGTDLVLATKPGSLSFTVAAAIPLAGATALDCVEAIDVTAGDTVLVAGATGGVGSVAIQLAVQRGATVIATAKEGDEAAFVRALGASETIDYAAVDVVDAIRSRFPAGVDALIDTVNRGDDFGRLVEVVRDGGRVATTLGAADAESLAARDVRATNIMGTPTPAKLTALAAQVVAGTLRIEVQRTFPLSQAGAAITSFSAGTRGKIVIEV